jgi:hypothetical protein
MIPHLKYMHPQNIRNWLNEVKEMLYDELEIKMNHNHKEYFDKFDKLDNKYIMTSITNFILRCENLSIIS